MVTFLSKTKDFTFYWKSNGYGISTSKKENVRKIIFWDITFQRKKIDGWHGFSRIFCNRTLKCRTFVWCFFSPFCLFLKLKLSINIFLTIMLAKHISINSIFQVIEPNPRLYQWFFYTCPQKEIWNDLPKLFLKE